MSIQFYQVLFRKIVRVNKSAMPTLSPTRPSSLVLPQLVSQPALWRRQDWLCRLVQWPRLRHDPDSASSHQPQELCRGHPDWIGRRRRHQHELQQSCSTAKPEHSSKLLQPQVQHSSSKLSSELSSSSAGGKPAVNLPYLKYNFIPAAHDKAFPLPLDH